MTTGAPASLGLLRQALAMLMWLRRDDIQRVICNVASDQRAQLLQPQTRSFADRLAQSEQTTQQVI